MVNGYTITVYGQHLDALPEDSVLLLGYSKGSSIDLPLTSHVWLQLQSKSETQATYVYTQSSQNLPRIYHPDGIYIPKEPPRTLLIDLWDLQQSY